MGEFEIIFKSVSKRCSSVLSEEIMDGNEDDNDDLDWYHFLKGWPT